MSDTNPSPRLEEETKQWVDRLLAGAGEERRHAAAELRRLGVWSRGSVRTRGSLTRTAKRRLPQPAQLDKIIRCLKDADDRVRSQLAVALGEWGGEESATALAELLRAETNEAVQLYCINGLASIGGSVALRGLQHAIQHGTAAVQDAAISAIEELATGGRLDDTDNSSFTAPAAERTRGAVRVRGAVRTRGAVTRGREPNAVKGVRVALEDVRRDRRASKYLRHRAAEVMGYIDEP